MYEVPSYGRCERSYSTVRTTPTVRAPPSHGKARGRESVACVGRGKVLTEAKTKELWAFSYRRRSHVS